MKLALQVSGLQKMVAEDLPQLASLFQGDAQNSSNPVVQKLTQQLTGI
jgi:hypothetical protein